MRKDVPEKNLNINVRIDAETEKKYFEIWDKLQANLTYPIRLKKQDVFAVIVNEYHKILLGEKNGL